MRLFNSAAALVPVRPKADLKAVMAHVASFKHFRTVALGVDEDNTSYLESEMKAPSDVQRAHAPVRMFGSAIYYPVMRLPGSIQP